MKKSILALNSTLFSLLFAFLFYDRSLGLNLIIFEIAILSFLIFTKKISISNPRIILGLGFVLITGITAVINYSGLTIFLNCFFFILFSGLVAFDNSRSYLSNYLLPLFNIFKATSEFRRNATENSRFGLKTKRFFKFIELYGIPLFILGVFVTLYNNSNPFFSDLSSTIFGSMMDVVTDIFEYVNFGFIAVFIFGLFVVNIFLFSQKTKFIKAFDNSFLKFRKRVRDKSNNSGILGLKKENRSAVFLFAFLNIILFVFILFDIQLVFFDFDWNGDTLKSFVHEGTYNLLFSVVISILLILYFFRGNLKFYKKNKLLKLLSFIFIIQNMVLLITLFTRNIYYVDYYSLAYLRIGLFIFLISLVFLLITLSKFINKNWTIRYLIEKNINFIFIVMLLVSLVDLEKQIAICNRAHIGKSYYDLHFHSRMSNKNLHLVDLTDEELNKIQTFQNGNYNFNHLNLDKNMYKTRVKNKILHLKETGKTNQF